jgi:c-di-GMP-binding flagellar brake protein YcgR
MSNASSFSISNPRQIVQNLSILIKNKCLLSVRFGEGSAFFLTAILEIDEANKSLVFDCAPKEVLNQQLLKAGRIVFEADFAGIKVSFKGSLPEQITYNGEPAFSMPIPESIFWMQRREFFRIKSPRSKSSYCRLIFEDQEPVDLQLYDISLTGFSVLNTSAEISELLVSGALIEKARLVLSGAGEDAVSFKVCSKLVINPEKIAALRIQKIGCEFSRITPAFESVVQRYINQLQRESLQKMNG